MDLISAIHNPVFKKKLFSLLIVCAALICVTYIYNEAFRNSKSLLNVITFSPSTQNESHEITTINSNTPIAQMIRLNKIGNAAILSIAHYEQRQAVQKWISGLKLNKYKKFLVLCYDQNLVEFLKKQGYKRNAVLLPSEWISNSSSGNIMLSKAKIWYNLINLGHSFVYSDPDVVWKSGSVLAHLEYKYKYSNGEVMFSQDRVSRGLYYNTCFFYARATRFARELFIRVDSERNSTIRGNVDQLTLNKILLSSNFNDSRVERLDMMLYATNSLENFDQKLNQNTSVAPLVVIPNQSTNNLPITKFNYRTETGSRLEAKDETDTQIADIMRNNKISNITIITIANFGFRLLVHNLILSLNKNNYNKFVVFCYDQELINYLSQKGFKKNVILVPSKWLDFNLSASSSRYGEEAYNLLVRSKTNIWYHLLMQGHSFVFSDPDIVWLSKHVIDHLKFQYDHSNAEILFSQDLQKRTPYCNTGFFMATPTRFVQDLFGNMLKLQHLPNKRDTYEQYILRDMIAAGKFNDTRLDTLDLLLYANGQVHFIDNLNKKMSISPLVVHANYFMGERRKIIKLKSKRYWFL